MKLHLPISLRKALLACITSFIIPALSLGSGAFYTAAAAESETLALQPTLSSTEKGSAYSIVSATKKDKDAFCVYETDEDGTLQPRYYKIVVAEAESENVVAEDVDIALHWGVSDGKLTLDAVGETAPEGADIEYHTKVDDQKRHLVFLDGTTDFGEGDETVTFHWAWVDYGTAEREGAPAFRYVFQKGDGASNMVYWYDASTALERIVVEAGNEHDAVSGVFVENEIAQSQTIPDLNYEPDAPLQLVSFGAAIRNNGTIASVTGDFMSNLVRNEVVIKGTTWNDSVTTLLAYGGAIYNSGVISGAVNGNFLGNAAETSFDPQGGVNFEAERTVMRHNALGGAVYNGIGGNGAANSTSITSVTGSYIGNYAKTELKMYWSSFSDTTITMSAAGGALYNGIAEISADGETYRAAVEELISGDFVGNYAYNDHFSSVSKGTIHTYALGGAVHSGIFEIEGNGVNVSARVETIRNSKFIGNFVYDANPFVSGTSPGGVGDTDAEKKFHAFGGAVYNGIESIAVGNSELSSSIGSIQDSDFVANYASSRNYTSVASSDKTTSLRDFAFGGAVYNGIGEISTADGKISSRIGIISGSVFSGNYASVYRKTALDCPFEIDYAFGGAIHNGIADIKSGAIEGTIVASIDTIASDFKENYVSVTSDARHSVSYAHGGAVYNGLSDMDGITFNGEEITSGIQRISGSFTRNYASTCNFFSSTGNNTSGGGQKEHALGGAIYNGISELREVIANGGEIGSSIDSIEGTFIGNYTSTERGTVPNSTARALGGAIYNGIGDVSGSNGSFSASIAGGIKGSFADNYAQNLSGSTLNHAFGGALYNGIEVISNSSGAMTASISEVAATFKQNRAITIGASNTAFAGGGAIYNGVDSIQGLENVFDGDDIKLNLYLSRFSTSLVDNEPDMKTPSGRIENSEDVSEVERDPLAYESVVVESPDQREKLINNRGVEIGASIDVIEGQFEKNFAEGPQAKGGALFNGLGSVGATKEAMTNEHSIRYEYSHPSISGSSNIRLTFEGLKLSDKFQTKKEYVGIYDNSENGLIRSHIGSITGDFTGNSVQATSLSGAMGGAVHNELGVVCAAGGSIHNKNSTSLYYTFKIESSATKPNNDIEINFGDKIEVSALTENTYKGIFNNSKGTIESTIGSINGHFVGNYATSSSNFAAGGAISNMLGEISANMAKVYNTNESTLYLKPYVSHSKGVNLTYGTDFKSANTIVNEYSGLFNNSGGKVVASISEIVGDFVENYATTTSGTVKGGAIYNSLGSLFGSHGEVVNNNSLVSDYGRQYSDISEVSHDYQGEYDILNSIENVYTGVIDNSNGVIEVSVDDIIGDFVNNRSEATSTSSHAYGGAIYNGIEDICAGSGSVTNTNSVAFSYLSSENVFEIHGDHFASENSIQDTFIGEINNAGGVIRAAVGDITGNFIQNAARATYAKGGALYNGIGSITGSVGKVVNNESSADNSISASFIGSINNENGKILARIDSIVGHFIGNYAASDSTTGGEAMGGAIYNTIGSITDSRITVEGEADYTIGGTINNADGEIAATIGSITGDFIGNYASHRLYAYGGAIYNAIGDIISSKGKIINAGGVITASIDSINGNFIGNSVSGRTVAKGGAIYNGLGSVSLAEGGGASFNNEGGTISATIGSIIGDFTNNSIEGVSRTTTAYGGAIYNGVDSVAANLGGKVEARIGSIIGNFTNNSISGPSSCGGAVYNAGSIGDVTAGADREKNGFVTNTAGSGGAIYNTGDIGQIVSQNQAVTPEVETGFVGNEAALQGGAVYNSGSIGSIVNMNFVENTAGQGASALMNSGSIGRIGADADSASEYDNTIVGGIINSGFKGNVISSYAENSAALYTTTDLALIADPDQAGSAHIVFENNRNGDDKDSDIYVDGESTTFYMIAKKDGSITTNGEINGKQGYVLRLRGFTQKADDVWTTHGASSASGGLVNLQGLVVNAHVVMDDVTLQLGRAKAADTQGYVVYEDTLPRGFNDNHELHPGDILFDGVVYKGEEPDGEHTALRVYSDVLRDSTLELRSGHVLANRYLLDDKEDIHVINYNIGTLVSYGYLSYNPEVANGGYYGKDANVNLDWATGIKNPLYGTWSISIDLNRLSANTITAWVDPKAEQSTRGYVTLSGISVLAQYACGTETEPFEDWWEHSDVSPYLDVSIQVLNLLRPGETGREAPPTEWTQEGDINSSAPLQLDLSLLQQKSEALAFMTSNDILCEGYGYDTTKTWHDSIRIWGWRDNLAAWAELEQPETTTEGHYSKEFHILDGSQVLTRNIRLGQNASLSEEAESLLQGDNFKIYGNGIERSTLDVNGYNLLSMIKQGQTFELQGLTIINVGTKDTTEDGAPGDGRNRIQNDGKLILDMVYVENTIDHPENGNNLVVTNDGDTVKRGSWDIKNVFTSSQGAQASTKLEPKEMLGADYTAPTRVAVAPGRDIVGASSGVANSFTFEHGTTNILGTMEYQNITHCADAVTYLVVHSEADARGSDASGDRFSTAKHGDGGTVTDAFHNFYSNSLTMQGGDFYLRNLNSAELKLRDLTISGGTIHLNSVTVNLDGTDPELKSHGSMGRIWAYDSAAYTGEGKIVVESLKLMRTDGTGETRSGDARYYNGAKHIAIPVQFVNPEVAAAVVPFNKENDYDAKKENKSNSYAVEGNKFVYDVDYDYTTGEYTYRRKLTVSEGGTPGTPGDFTPGTITSPVAQAAGAVSALTQLNDSVFQHADLFSANVYAAQKDRLRERAFTIVSPMKGKNSVATTRSQEKGSACSRLAAFKGGLWVRPYAGTEELTPATGLKVTNNMYGALVGGDTALNEHRNGWSSVFSAHVGYMGSTQRYRGSVSSANIRQNGGVVGATETLYKRNFYTALSASLGTSSAHAESSGGTDNFNMLLGTLASRSGYSFELAKARLVVQPTLLLAYNLVSTENYTNAAGTRISSDPMHTLQLHPYVKFIVNTDTCWQPFATVGYVHNFFGNTKFRADDITLPEMSIDPYMEYSVGAQRSWADKYTFFGEVTGRSGGRDGYQVSAGLRWAW